MIESDSRIVRDVQRRVRARQAIEESVSLEVTLLGDGRGLPEYHKREQLGDRLAQNRFVSHIAIPERLRDANPEATVDEVERSATEKADVVLFVEAPARAPLGAYTEASLYFDRSKPDKWFRCRPLERADSTGEDTMVAALAEGPFSRIETFDYDPDEWEECGRITSNCIRRVELMAAREIDRRVAQRERREAEPRDAIG